MAQRLPKYRNVRNHVGVCSGRAITRGENRGCFGMRTNGMKRYMIGMGGRIGECCGLGESFKSKLRSSSRMCELGGWGGDGGWGWGIDGVQISFPIISPDKFKGPD